MTPQEKAIELVGKFLPEVRGADRYSFNVERMNVFIAKRCAHIAVDEILKTSFNMGFIDYWEQVKTEIGKL